MALDQGTSSSRAIIYDATGEVVTVAQTDIDLFFPADGWVEQDPEQLWQSILTVGRLAIAQSGLAADAIKAIGITNQRETTLLWERATGNCVHNALVWQDRRTAALCQQMATDTLADGKPLAESISDITGLIIDPYFSSTKLGWLLDNVAGARAAARDGQLCFGTVDSFLLWKFSKGQRHLTDATNASRTQLFDINAQVWSEELLAYFDIPQAILPEVMDSAGHFAVADPEWFGAPIPITGVAGDQQAALIGQACFSAGMSKSTYGTGCFLLMNTGNNLKLSENGLISTIACSSDNKVTYALEGSVFIAGAAIQWLRDSLGLIKNARETEDIANSLDDLKDIYVVPAFAGLGAPYWDMYSRGAIFGLTRDTGKDHIIKATLESLAFQTRDIIDVMQKDSNINLSSLKVDGGACMNNYLMQFQSDILGSKVIRPDIIETTAMGAGYLAGINSGIWDEEKIKSLQKIDKTFSPQIEKNKRTKIYSGWKKAVKRTFNWLEK